MLTLLCNWLGRMGPSVRDLRLDADGLGDAKEHGRRYLNPDSCSCQRKDRSGLLWKWANSAGPLVQDLRSESGRRPSTEVSSRGWSRMTLPEVGVAWLLQIVDLLAS